MIIDIQEGQKYQKPFKLQLSRLIISICAGLQYIRGHCDNLMSVWNILVKITEALTNIIQDLREKNDVLHKRPRTIGTKYIWIQVLGTQEKNLQLGLFKDMEVRSMKLCLNYNQLGQ